MEEANMKKIVLAGALIMAVVATAAWAEQGQPDTRGPGMPGRGHHWYDPSKAETIKGQVLKVNVIESRQGVHSAVSLAVNASGKTMTVHLGPQFYIESQPVKIAEGDQVEITGVKYMRGDEEILVAGQVKKGDQVLKLHDENGRPLWAGQGPGPRPGAGPGPQQKRPAVGC
jgi:hypothetical protein